MSHNGAAATRASAESAAAAPTPEEQQHLIARLDDAIIRLIRQRNAECARLDRVRQSLGQPRVELSRENSMLQRYRDELGAHGTDLGLLLLKMSRT
ncbi:chorismate mutase [Streptomyces sp. NPDC049627]|uniref:chorismate mutase n=1 Tax=Streptomyces sp. NPDC049627 TaxID=3365595 RepID=UPI0037B9A73B